MIDVKKTLGLILKRLTFRRAETDSVETTLNANGTAWISVPVPNAGTPVCVIGYYFIGTGSSIVHPYAIQYKSDGTGVYFALKNHGTSQAKITVRAYWLVVG